MAKINEVFTIVWKDGKTKEFTNREEAKQFFDVKYLNQLLEEHKAEKHDNSRKIWTVYIFLIWYNRFFVNGECKGEK
jgi:asparagine synthase (glutamine-hydrolysing)